MLLPFKVREENGRFTVRDGYGDRYDILDDERAAERIAHLMTVATERHRALARGPGPYELRAQADHIEDTHPGTAQLLRDAANSIQQATR